MNYKKKIEGLIDKSECAEKLFPEQETYQKIFKMGYLIGQSMALINRKTDSEWGQIDRILTQVKEIENLKREIAYFKELIEDMKNSLLKENQTQKQVKNLNVIEDIFQKLLSKSRESIYSPLRNEIVDLADIKEIFTEYNIEEKNKF